MDQKEEPRDRYYSFFSEELEQKKEIKIQQKKKRYSIFSRPTTTADKKADQEEVEDSLKTFIDAYLPPPVAANDRKDFIDSVLSFLKDE